MSNFQQDLLFSRSHNVLWDGLYKKAFPDLVAVTRVEANCPAQGLGVDTVLVMGSGAVVRVEEKLSRGQYDNFFLEYEAHGKPGWVEKPLQVDYVAYTFLPTQTMYLLPWLPLQRAWRKHRMQWLAKYNKVIPTASGATVPILEVYAAIQEAMQAK